MAAFLEVDVLRAHAVPALPRAVLGPALTPPRPVLTARWLVAPGRRLTCRWQADATTLHDPPPH